MLIGIIVCFVMALAATWLAGIQHIIGAPLLGLFLGIILANCMPQKFLDQSKTGAGFCSKRILRVGIILAGGTLNFSAIMKVAVGQVDACSWQHAFAGGRWNLHLRRYGGGYFVCRN